MTTTIHPTMMNFLKDSATRGAMGKSKRRAFICEIQPDELGIVLMDRSSGDIEIMVLDGEPSSTQVNYKGKTTPITAAPFASPESWLTTLLDREETSNNDEEATISTPKKTAPKKKAPTKDLPPVPKKVAARKKTSTKTAKVKKETIKKAKTARVILTPAQRLVKNLLKELNLEENGIPASSELFKIVDRRGNTKVALNSIAVFCDSEKIANASGKGMGTRALADMSMNTGADNIMNLLAEVNPERMKAVGREILRLGVLLEDITVVKTKDILPTSPESFAERVDEDGYQCISGRHRLAFLGLLYGTDVKIPVRVLEGEYIDYPFAARATVMSNDTRPLGKEEAVYYHGLLEELTAKDVTNEFKRTKGKLGAISKFASYHAVLRKDDACGSATMQVTDKPLKGTYSLTIVNWKNCFHEIIGSLIQEDPTLIQNWDTAQGAIKAAVNGVNNLFAAIPKVDPAYPTFSSVWTAYGSTVLGKLLGNALRAGIRSGKTLVPNELAEKVAAVVVEFAKDKGTTVFARETRSMLLPMIEEFATEKGMDLPRLAAVRVQF